MKKLLLVLLVLLFISSAYAGRTIDSVGPMMDQVRQLTMLESTTFLPDSTLRGCCLRALKWTSIDIGGVERQYRFLTVSGTAFYAIPDSITEVVFVTLRTQEGVTKSLKAWYPQFFEDLGVIEGDPYSSTENDIPLVYNYWSDSLQLMPAPVREDTVILKVYVEHKTMLNSSTADTMRIGFSSDAYTQAALYYAGFEALVATDNLDKAAIFIQFYDKKKADLKAVFTRKFDILKQ